MDSLVEIPRCCSSRSGERVFTYAAVWLAFNAQCFKHTWSIEVGNPFTPRHYATLSSNISPPPVPHPTLPTIQASICYPKLLLTVMQASREKHHYSLQTIPAQNEHHSRNIPLFQL